MKIGILIGALVLSYAVNVHADTVTLYGIVDAGIEYINKAGPARNSLVRMPDLTASVPSRFGLRGSEDLGGGLRATFVLESGFAADSGVFNYGGRLFGRQSNVALSNANWSVTLGRQYDMTFYAMMDTDVLGPNIYAVSDLDAYLPNTRTDNAVGLMGKTGLFSYGATYSLGRDAAGPTGPQATNCGGELASNASACRQWTLMAKYADAPFGVSASFDHMNGGPGALLGLNNANYSDERSTINVYVMAGTAKIGGGILHRKNVSAASLSSNLTYLGISYPLAQWTFDAQAMRLNIIGTKNDAEMLAIRATYHLSRRSALYATAGHINNSGVSAMAVSPGVANSPGMSQSGVMIGIRHTF